MMKRARGLLPVFFLVGGYLAALWAAERVTAAPLPAIGSGLLEPSNACTAWEQVNAPGFGLETFPAGDPETPPYQSEDAFELIVFAGQLYVGMEADNAHGARLWRTRRGVAQPQGQADWEEVSADAQGRPWGVENRALVDHIDSLAEFNGMLYASTASRGVGGARVFRSATGDPGTWEDALAGIGPGFGDPANENFKDMQVFNGQLCGGTWNATDGAEVWCTADGLSWSQANRSGFGEAANIIIWSGAVFEDHLYFGLQRIESGENGQAIPIGRIYRTDTPGDPDAWELVYDGGPFSFWAGLLGEVDGALYAAHPGWGGIRVLQSQDGAPGTWEPAGRPGLDHSRYNTTTGTDASVVYNGELHMAVSNPLLGFRVWRLSRPDFWEVAGRTDSYDPADQAAQLVEFNGSLYAWTINYARGQRVLRMTCAAGEQPAVARGLFSTAIVVGLGLVIIFSVRLPGYNRSEGHLI